MQPFDGGKGPTMSTCSWSNRASGVANVETGLKVCLCTLERWHCKHD